MIISRACPTCRSSLKLTQKDLFDDRYGSPGKHSVFSCPKCGFGKTIPGLNRQNIGKFYARYYPLSNENPKEM
ncbi:MAG: Methyltransferase family protein, partial [Microgenomates group bacterium GW2011_GWF1_38_5]